MKTTLTLSKKLLNSITLPGMGRSIELNGLTPEENQKLKQAYSTSNLQVEFEEEQGAFHEVLNLWADPHTTERMTLFI